MTKANFLVNEWGSKQMGKPNVLYIYSCDVWWCYLWAMHSNSTSVWANGVSDPSKGAYKLLHYSHFDFTLFWPTVLDGDIRRTPSCKNSIFSFSFLHIWICLWGYLNPHNERLHLFLAACSTNKKSTVGSIFWISMRNSFKNMMSKVSDQGNRSAASQPKHGEDKWAEQAMRWGQIYSHMNKKTIWAIRDKQFTVTQTFLKSGCK